MLIHPHTHTHTHACIPTHTVLLPPPGTALKGEAPSKTDCATPSSYATTHSLTHIDSRNILCNLKPSLAACQDSSYTHYFSGNYWHCQALMEGSQIWLPADISKLSSPLLSSLSPFAKPLPHMGNTHLRWDFFFPIIFSEPTSPYGHFGSIAISQRDKK